MSTYILRRLLLIPLSLFFIILVNFVIINLAPGDPITITEISQEGEATRQQGKSEVFGSNDRYLQFREYYGLTLPILFNSWPSISQKQLDRTLWQLQYKKKNAESEEMAVKDYDKLRILLGDQARFIMPKLLSVMENQHKDLPLRSLAARFFIRGGTRQGFTGPHLTEEQKKFNRKVASDNIFLLEQLPLTHENLQEVEKKISLLKSWYEENKNFTHFTYDLPEKIAIFFTDTRLFRYLARVLTLDFGTLRDDPNKTVIYEVTRRFKYSLTLALIPMLITFVLCQLFGFIMAIKQQQWQDHFLNLCCLVLYALPVFVVAPFLIEKVALNHYFPFTQIPIPISGFTSPDFLYNKMTSSQRVFDIIQHISLPILAIIYGSLASQSRLSRTAVLEVMRQDYVRTAHAKGLAPSKIYIKHVGRNAAITIVTSIASSLGIILGGSLIVETIFEINGFGKFFYDAVINRDYNVIMFSAFAGSFLTLIGYLVADIAYTLLDPRLTLE